LCPCCVIERLLSRGPRLRLLDTSIAPPAEAPRGRGREAEPVIVDHEALGDDPPDPLIGGAVDLGSVVSEHLTLALDPYPRKPGAQFVEPAAEDGVVSPFAQLRRPQND